MIKLFLFTLKVLFGVINMKDFQNMLFWTENKFWKEVIWRAEVNLNYFNTLGKFF